MSQELSDNEEVRVNTRNQVDSNDFQATAQLNRTIHHNLKSKSEGANKIAIETYRNTESLKVWNSFSVFDTPQ